MITRHISGIVHQTFDEHGKLVSQKFVADESNENHQFYYDKHGQLVDPEDYFDAAPEVEPQMVQGLDTNLLEILDTAQDHGADLKPLLHGLFETFGNQGVIDYLGKMGKRCFGSDPVVQECREKGEKACRLGKTPHIDGVCALCEVREFYTLDFLKAKDARK
jgi:hypothetical protein